MRITKKQLIKIIREEAKKDQNKDGKNDFGDVKIARMKASGMSDEEIRKKHPELFEAENKTIMRESEIRAIIRTELKESLWDAIRKKRARGEPPAKPGDKDYPDEKSWKAATNEDDKEEVSESITRGAVELTDQPDRRAVSDAWPERVTHNGKNVFDTFYGAPGGGGSSDALDWLSREGYDGQEVYLGYDPQSDNFVMGFDAFYEEYDSYGDPIQDSEMEGVLILLDPRGRALETITSVPGGIYPRGIQAVRSAMPEIIDVRLD